MPLSREGKERSFHENVVLAFCLASVAGAVNVIGFVELGYLTSHVTGSATRLGQQLSTGAWTLAGQLALLLGAFVFGAMSATLLIEISKRTHHPRFQLPLLIEALFLIGFTVVSELVHPLSDTEKYGLAVALSYAMGLQNALVTRLSGAVVRTTHLTGLLTDFGIELVHVLTWYRDKTRGESLLDHLRHISIVRKDPELYRARLHLTIFLSFVAGATAGATLFARFGARATVAPVIVLLVLIIYDRYLNISEEDLDANYNPAFDEPPAQTSG